MPRIGIRMSKSIKKYQKEPPVEGAKSIYYNWQ